MTKEKAIIISANLKGNFRPESKGVGNILEHASHIEKNGAVLWSIVPPGRRFVLSFPHPEIKRGYFYNVTEKAVPYAFDINYICAADQIESKRESFRYLIDARKIGWKNWPDYYYWMKVSGIYRLKKEHSLNEFKKHEDGKPITTCRNYSIIIDPYYAHHDKNITRREIMTDYIGDLLIAGKITEKDIEELFSYRLADKLSLVERQGTFRKAGRLDLLYKTTSNRYILYELKKGIARLPAIDQIKGYMKHVIRKHKVKAEDIKGIILAKSIDPELSAALKNEKNIEAKTYFFKIDMK